MDSINQQLETIKKLAIELRKVENLNEMAGAYKDRASQLEELTSKLLDSVDQCIKKSNELLQENKEAIECYKENNLTLLRKVSDDFYVIREAQREQKEITNSTAIKMLNNNSSFAIRIDTRIDYLRNQIAETIKYDKRGIVLLVAIVLIQLFTTIYILWIK